MKEEYYDLFPNLREVQDSLETTTSEMDALRAKLEAEREKTRVLSEALEWYAEPANYENGRAGENRDIADHTPTIKFWKSDNGERARRALGKK